MGAGLHIGPLVTALGFGFRHGIDWDHIAALTDLTGAQQDGARRSMVLATLYAIGHAAVVFALGFAAIVLAARLPEGIDSVLQRFVGVTLIALGAYVIVTLLRHGRDFRMRSRWMLLAAGVRHGLRRVRGAGEVVVIEHEHEHAVAEAHVRDAVLVGAAHGHAHHGTHSHRHRHVAAVPDDPFPRVGSWTAVLIGMLHGIGAETPTQVLLFVTAAGVAGKVGGVLLLVTFIAGLLLANTMVAAVSTFGALHATRNFSVYAATSVMTAVFSIITGAIFVFGFASVLPALLGG